MIDKHELLDELDRRIASGDLPDVPADGNRLVYDLCLAAQRLANELLRILDEAMEDGDGRVCQGCVEAAAPLRDAYAAALDALFECGWWALQ